MLVCMVTDKDIKSMDKASNYNFNFFNSKIDADKIDQNIINKINYILTYKPPFSNLRRFLTRLM
jgi:hypothetical protein